jgi:hypothetical protein
MSEKIFCGNPFHEVRQSHIGTNLIPIQPQMINLVGTVKQSGKICAKCRIIFYKMRKTCGLYDKPEADAIQLQLSKKSIVHTMKQKI